MQAEGKKTAATTPGVGPSVFKEIEDKGECLKESYASRDTDKLFVGKMEKWRQ